MRKKQLATLIQSEAKSVIFNDDAEAPEGLELIECIFSIDGVHGVQINYDSHLITFDYDQDRVTLQQIQSAIEKKVRNASRSTLDPGV